MSGARRADSCSFLSPPQAFFIQGNLVDANESSYVNITNPDQVAFLCCDSMNLSFIDPDLMLNTLMDNKPKAILLYSLLETCCTLGGENLEYSTILTMIDAESAQTALNYTSNTANVAVRATITGNGTSSGQDQQDGQNGSNSAIAMSILYSITGLITLLFLVIIATGAIRAHRYPERYGPRSAYGGRPRQSRAKGIARAVLETIPIVKFGAPAPAGKPDPNIELEDGPADRGRQASNDLQVHHLSTIPEDAEAQPKTSNSPERESRIGPDTPAAGQNGSTPDPIGDEHLGCSICTEDFTVGEDVRVLPCDHKFHPPCIDPWLINVSGTCPLWYVARLFHFYLALSSRNFFCSFLFFLLTGWGLSCSRLDLRPNKGEAEGGASQDVTQLAPPLEDGGDHEAGETSTQGQRRRSSRFFDLNRLRHASVEERLEVLRRYRSENQTDPTTNAADGEDERKRSAKLTNRLRDKFRIRTRAQSPGVSSRAARRSADNQSR